MVPAECYSKHRHVTASLDSAEALLSVQEASCHPAHDHLAVFPPLDVAGHVAGDGDHRLDGVGGLERVQQAAAQAESGNGECFFQSLQQAGSCTRVFDLQLFGERPQLRFGAPRIRLTPGLVQLAADEHPLGLRQMLEHISALVLSAPMNDGIRAKGAHDGRADGLATIDHEQPRLLNVQPALDQVAKQRVADRLVLSGALPKAKGMLATISVDAQGDHDAVLGDLDPVDEHGHQIQLAEVPAEQFGQLLLGSLNETLRDGRLGGSTRLHLADGFQTG